MQATRSDQRLEEKFGEVGEAVRVNANLSDHLAEIFSIIFKDPQQTVQRNGKVFEVMDVFYVTEKCSLIRIAVQTYELKFWGDF